MGQGVITLNEVAAPTAPSAGKQNQYCDTADKRFKIIDANGVINSLNETVKKNFLRNGSLYFAQRQAPGTLTTYSNLTGRSISADGWGITNENASVQYIRVVTAAAAETGEQVITYGTWSKITNTGKIVLSQVVGGDETADLRGRTVRFQVWLKASAAKTVKIAVIQNAAAATMDVIAATFISAFGANSVDPTLGTNLAYLAPKAGVSGDNCTAGANAFSCSVTTAWQRFGGVVDVPSNLKNLVVVVFTDSQFAAADSVSVTQASLTDGYEIQDVQQLDYIAEFRKVQRFYCKSFPPDTNPAQSVGVNLGEIRAVAGKAGAVANAGYIPIRFPCTLIKSPTVTVYNPAAANALARNITGGADMGTTTIVGTSADDFYTNSTGVAATAVGDLIAIHYTADAEI